MKLNIFKHFQLNKFKLVKIFENNVDSTVLKSNDLLGLKKMQRIRRNENLYLIYN